MTDTIHAETRKASLTHVASMRVGKGADVYDFIGVFTTGSFPCTKRYIIHYNKGCLPHTSCLESGNLHREGEYAAILTTKDNGLHEAFVQIHSACSEWKERDSNYALVAFSYLVGYCKASGVDLFELSIVD